MEFLQKYRILCIVTLAFGGGAYYELNYIESVSNFVPVMAQPNPAAELLIELYPQRPGSICLEADRAVYLRYDLETAKTNLETAISQNYKDDASYFYNYASVLMLLGAPKKEIEEAVRQWRVHGIPVQNELDPRVIYQGVTFPLPLEEGATRLMTKSLDGRRIAIAPEMSATASTMYAEIQDLLEPNPNYRTKNIRATTRFTALSLAHDGSHIISANEGGVMTIINLDSQKFLHRLTNTSGDIFAAAVIPSRNIAITGDRSGLVKIWDLVDGSILHTEPAANRSVSAITVSPNESLLATGDWDGNVTVWELNETNGIKKIGFNDAGHQGVITNLVFGADNTTLASASRDHTARIFKLDTTLNVTTMVKHRAPIYGLDIAPSGTQFVTAGEDQVLAVWAVSDGRPIQKDVKPLPIYSALFTTKPNELMIVNEQQQLSYERVASP